MKASSWCEAVSGVLAGAAGEAAVVYLFTAPAYSGAGCRIASPGEPPICVTGTATLVDVNGSGAVGLLSVLAILLVGIAVAAVWHSRTGRGGVRALLWICTGALTVVAVLSLLTIGILLLPSVALALVASLCALASARGPSIA